MLFVTSIGLVTTSSVFHWSMDGDSQPQKVFDKHISLAGSQIISYRVNSDRKWMVLVGISSQQGRVVGNMQLFSKEKNFSQPLEGHADSFAELNLDRCASPTRLFTFSVRTTTGAKVIIE